MIDADSAVPFTPEHRMPIVVLASGGGTNLAALIARAKEPSCCFRIAAVVVNVAGARAISRGLDAGLPVYVVPHRDHGSRASFEGAMLDAIAPHRPAFVVLAGFMRVLTDTFIGAFPRRIVNVHPALLPAFPGLHGAQQALDAGARISGCTVHLVDAGVDTGPILLQAAVPVSESDTEATLSARIQAAEHKILPIVVDALAQGRLCTEGERTWLRALKPSADVLSFSSR